MEFLQLIELSAADRDEIPGENGTWMQRCWVEVCHA